MEVGAVSVGYIITVLWVYLYCYLILASIDFGAGVYAYYSLKAKEEKSVAVLRLYLSPIWDVFHIILLVLIFLLTSFLPLIIEDYGEPLKIPALVVIALIILRTALIVFKRKRIGTNKPITFIYGFSGLIVALVLTSVLTLSEGGFLQITESNVSLSPGLLLSSFYFWSVVILAVVSVFYISAMYFILFSYRTKNPEALERFRTYAMAWCVPTLLASVLVFVALQRHNPDHFNRMLDISWLFLLSLVSYLIAVSLVFYKRHYALAFFFVLCQFFFAFYGYGWSHLPYLLYPYIEIHPFNSFGIGAVIFILSFILSLGIPSLILRVRRMTVSMKKKKSES